jgi:hypothetical protein
MGPALPGDTLSIFPKLASSRACYPQGFTTDAFPQHTCSLGPGPALFAPGVLPKYLDPMILVQSELSPKIRFAALYLSVCRCFSRDRAAIYTLSYEMHVVAKRIFMKFGLDFMPLEAVPK